MFCSKCGKKIPGDSIFCNSCGLKLEIEENFKKKQTAINYHEGSPKPIITIDQDLSFYKTFLLYKGKNYSYSDIKDINYSRFVATMNLVPIVNKTGFFIGFDNDEEINYNIDKSIFRDKTSNILEQAYNYLLLFCSYNLMPKIIKYQSLPAPLEVSF